MNGAWLFGRRHAGAAPSGYAIFEVMFGGFYTANVGSATGVDRAEVLQCRCWSRTRPYAALTPAR